MFRGLVENFTLKSSLQAINSVPLLANSSLKRTTGGTRRSDLSKGSGGQHNENTDAGGVSKENHNDNS